MKLNTTLHTFSALRDTVNETRGKHVKVSREDLDALLRDHSKMAGELREIGKEIEDS